MRQLTEEETKQLFSKLANYCGSAINNLIAPPSDEGVAADRYVFRLHGNRVYYLPLKLANLATSVPRHNLMCMGTMMGKFTKNTGKFRLNLTALDIIAPQARYKVWIKPNGEMPFLYGGHVLKAHVARFSEDSGEHQGILVLNMADQPLGFGITARSTAESRKLNPTDIVVFAQADAGMYLREEDSLFTT
ncbi:60S ribosome subunit biogenesis protein Nip7 [Penicillium alfredii]|uniref:60S ribosome subunit biogenesis protein NIP7 n=1 Tax=Penicillium alfredii TaxID=1506179 RepID=A0A9W9FL74_9EURO|nr:60S ribosome subunit biogenesis protein Nip7 [Penicillium alfredii]KAJ5102184.1 60S ribosome subunit biogenesis protein Nip7 [Penicillium alfredii]